MVIYNKKIHVQSLNKKQLGQWAENIACDYLQVKGLHLLAKNYRCYYGEIDLIMQEQDDIVFVEVRHRNNIEFGNAIESVNQNKINKLMKTAIHFLQYKEWLYQKNSRFDIVAIHPIAGKIQLEWIKNAFSEVTNQ